MKDSAPTAVPKKKKTTRRKRRPKEPTPTLRFSPFAWAKLLFLRDLGDTEVGGFGISNEDDPLLVEDVRLIGQRTTVVSVEFDDEAVADFFDAQVDAGLAVERWFRLWLHTHPGDSAEPSATDEETFERVFGRCDWAVMAILATGGQTYARMRFKAGPGGQIEIPIDVDFSVPFVGSDPVRWEREYDECVRPESPQFAPLKSAADDTGWKEFYGEEFLEGEFFQHDMSDAVDISLENDGRLHDEPIFAAE